MSRLNNHDKILILRRKRQRVKSNRPRPWLWAFQGMAAAALTIVLSITSVSAAGAATLLGIYGFYARQLPDASVIELQQDEFETVRIYDRTGQHLLYESVDPRPFRGDRTYLSLNEMSPWVWKASIALEDRSFWENPGINVRGLFRAFFSNAQGGGVQGGSSITQQLIKNVVIPVEERTQQSYARKIKEVILAMEVTRQYPKEKILEWYLNYNFYGNLAYGIEAASQVYFGKSASELNAAEAAILAPIPNFPALNPITNPPEAKERQRITLDALAAAGYLTPAEADEAFAQELNLRQSVAERFDVLTAPHFALYALERVKQEFNTANDPYFIWKKGLEVYTTLDVDLQKYAEQVARDHIRSLNNEGKEVNNASVVAIKPDTGEILAMVGSLDYNNNEIDGQVNVAISERQPGSSFKPYVYLTGLMQGMTTATMILDVRSSFPMVDGSYYVPENFDRLYHGPVSLRDALARSYNIPAIKVMDQVGVAAALRTAHRLGINGLNRGISFYGLSLVLGGGEVTLLDHTYAHSVLANSGVMAGQPVPPERQRTGFRTLDPVAILQVRDSSGTVLKKYEQPGVERIISVDAQYLLADIMSDDVARAPIFGANGLLTLPDRKVAAKTGTTNGNKDAWTMGFTPQLAVGVWVGNTDNTSMDRTTGASGASPIWNAVMRKYHEGLPARWYERPENITTRSVCSPSGLLPSSYCQRQRAEIFIAGTEPNVVDNIWQPFEVDSESGLLAASTTPAENRRTQVYMILPPEANDWVQNSGIAQPPRGTSQGFFVDFDPEVAITWPEPGGYISGQIEIRGNARSGDFRNYRIEFGPGLEPSSWTQIGPEHGEQIENGTLEFLDTRSLAEGLYTLRLSVLQGDGNVRQWNTQVTIDNTPPSVVISYPRPNQLYIVEDDEQVNVNAIANDTWAMDRVEFYRNRERYAQSTVAPYNERWRIVMQNIAVEGAGAQNWLGIDSNDPDITPGRIRTFDSGFAGVLTGNGTYLESHVFRVVAYDRAGNRAESEEVRIYVRNKKRN
ncbi:MAG: transglycosylase domain-containing protein [Caldilineaceae bacterium]|nr:transglycosylase domain-containing protein [Caldilineaceae bacterium]